MEWWKELGDVVIRHRRDGETFLFCIDSNARVGSVISNFVGGVERDEESKNGQFFHAFLARTGWLSQLLSEVVEALGRTVRGDGIGWITWESLAMSCLQFRAWRSIKRACWRSRSAKITAWLLSRCSGHFRGGRHLSPLMPLEHVLQIERSCGCQRFVISLNKSGVTRRLFRHNGPRR